MARKRKPKPQHKVTPDAVRVAESVMGLPLASPWRRGFAFLVDGVLVGLISAGLIATTVYLMIRRNNPEFLQTLKQTAILTEASQKDSLSKSLETQTIFIIYHWDQKRLSDELRKAVEQGDSVLVQKLADSYEFNYNIAFGGESVTKFDAFEKTALVDLHPFMGATSVVFNTFKVIILYFTLLPWIMKGHTPGKRLFKVRIVRLDGKRMKLWHTFERAGGYSASFATLGLGFLEAFWHPNRQTVHDRISGTVVILTKAPGKTED